MNFFKMILDDAIQGLAFTLRHLIVTRKTASPIYLGLDQYVFEPYGGLRVNGVPGQLPAKVYRVTGLGNGTLVIFRDGNLDRPECLHWRLALSS